MRWASPPQSPGCGGKSQVSLCRTPPEVKVLSEAHGQSSPSGLLTESVNHCLALCSVTELWRPKPRSESLGGRSATPEDLGHPHPRRLPLQSC